MKHTHYLRRHIPSGRVDRVAFSSDLSAAQRVSIIGTWNRWSRLGTSEWDYQLDQRRSDGSEHSVTDSIDIEPQERSPLKPYTRNGRTVLRDGVPLLHMARVDQAPCAENNYATGCYTLSVADADILAAKLVEALNRVEYIDQLVKEASK